MRSYLSLLFAFLGLTEIHFVSVEATTADTDTVARNLALAKQRAKNTIAA
jgi:FMN-dependent NADH-azoreductase